MQQERSSHKATKSASNAAMSPHLSYPDSNCNLPYLRIPQSHKYTKRMTDYEPRSTNPLSGSTSYIYKMR